MFPFRSVYLDRPLVPGRILDIFEAARPTSDTALFFVHGGGWHGGSRTIFHEIISAYRERGFDCASTDYRLGGANVLTKIADVQDAMRVFADDLAARDRRQRFALIGSSAGAHLALMAALRAPSFAPDYEVTHVCVQATPFTMEPWTDIFPAIWSDMRKAVGVEYDEEPQRYAEVSPIRFVTPAMPAVFALHAENEHMFPLDQTEEFAARAREVGVRCAYKIYPRTEHGFFYALDRWQQKEAFEDILRFVTNQDL